MLKNFNISKKNYKELFLIILFVGFFFRLGISSLGYMADIEWWVFINDINTLNGKFYGTGAVLYSPLWVHTLYLLDNIPFFELKDYDAFRYKVIIFLSIIDSIIFWLLTKRFSLLIGSIFLLNPVSIFITGFHNQFDNLAVLIGLIAVISYEKYKKYGLYICSIILGISLSFKHILFLFPVWLAIKEKVLIKKISIVIIPYAIFILAFSFYLPGQFNEILNDVFGYRSNNNGPFWSIFTPQFLNSYIGYYKLFLIAVFLLGFFVERKKIMETFLIYLLAVVTFSSAIANQYLAIPIAAMAVFWNPYFVLYTIACTIFFMIDHNALDNPEIKELLNWSRKKARLGYKIIIFFISIGLLEVLIGKKALNNFIKKTYMWFKIKIKNQFEFK